MTTYHDEFKILKTAVREAGHRVLELYQGEFHIRIKKDRSPVTTADLEVNHYLRDILLRAYPNDGWLSEEEPDNRARLTKSRVWILDPLDGTKYFIDGIPQFAISIALVENTEPVVAVVFNPATNEFFSAVHGHGTYVNDMPSRVRSDGTGRVTLLVNPPAYRRGAFCGIESIADCIPMGSIAYTLALISAGQADATINLSTQNEWDLAAGTLLIQEAGGVAMDRSWHPILFNKPNPSVQGIIATRPDRLDQIKELVQTLTTRK